MSTQWDNGNNERKLIKNDTQKEINYPFEWCVLITDRYSYVQTTWGLCYYYYDSDVQVYRWRSLPLNFLNHLVCFSVGIWKIKIVNIYFNIFFTYLPIFWKNINIKGFILIIFQFYKIIRNHNNTNFLPKNYIYIFLILLWKF